MFLLYTPPPPPPQSICESFLKVPKSTRSEHPFIPSSFLPSVCVGTCAFTLYSSSYILLLSSAEVPNENGRVLLFHDRKGRGLQAGTIEIEVHDHFRWEPLRRREIFCQKRVFIICSIQMLSCTKLYDILRISGCLLTARESCDGLSLQSEKFCHGHAGP